MLLIRFRKTFRERSPEWAMSLAMLTYGAILLMPAQSFATPYFASLAWMAPAAAWGGLLVAIGFGRLAALYINGSRWWTPLARQAGSIVGMLIWALLIGGAMRVQHPVPGIALLLQNFTLDALMLTFATRDLREALDHRASNGCG